MISSTMIQSRQRKLKGVIKETEFDGLILNPGPSLYYLTGFHFHLSERPIIFIYKNNFNPALILPELELAKVTNSNFPIDTFPYQENPSTWIDSFKKAANQLELSGNRLGIEPRGLRYLEQKFIEETSANIKLLPADKLIASLRMYKDEREIANMQEAAVIAEKALQATLPMIKVGITEKEIAFELSIQLIRHGSEPRLPFFPIVSGGPNSANPHASPSNRPLSSGDLLVIDYGASVSGYFSDITRTFAIGEADPVCMEIAEIVQQANAAGRSAVRPGVTASSVDHAARSIIENAGYGEYFIHRTGHGLGLEGHEEPYIRSDNDQKLEVGMTFTVEPGIYLPDSYGVRIEDDVIVTHDGVYSFTSLPRELITLS